MNRTDCLEGARQAVAERGTSYGAPEDNFARIGKLWSAMLDIDIPPHMVALMMAQLKTARLMNDPQSADGWIDGAGYFACGAEVATAPKGA